MTGTWVFGSQRRPDALAAVAEAMNLTVQAPRVEITSPSDNSSHPLSNELQLQGSATGFNGAPLPLTWTSSLDGQLGTGNLVALGPISVGTHTITASATDSTGTVGEASITVEVRYRAPHVELSAPQEGDEYWTNESIELRALARDPETLWESIPDDDTTWEIRSDDDVVWDGTGKKTTVPANELTPGQYSAVFTATSEGGDTQKTVGFRIIEVPPGQEGRVTTIEEPTDEALYTTSPGSKASITLKGSAEDGSGDPILGTRMRWLVKGAGETVELCRGNNVPGTPTEEGVVGDFVAESSTNDCSDVTVELGSPAAVSGEWQLVLESYDLSGEPHAAKQTLFVQSIVG